MPKHNTLFATLYDQTVSNTTPVTATTPMDDFDGCSLQLITGGSLAGAWKVEISNNYIVGLFGRPAAGDWTDITALFTAPAIAPVTTASNQFVQGAPLIVRAIKITFTPTSGTGRCAAHFAGKGNS